MDDFGYDLISTSAIVNRYEPIYEQAVNALGLDKDMMLYLEGRRWQLWALPHKLLHQKREFELRKPCNGGFIKVSLNQTTGMIDGIGLETLEHDIRDGERYMTEFPNYKNTPEFASGGVYREVMDETHCIGTDGLMHKIKLSDDNRFTKDGLWAGRKLPEDTQARVEKAIGSKATNPKDAIGSKKVPLFSVIPWPVIKEVALGLLEGALKYGRHNYRVYGVRASVYMDATLRHLSAWWEGQDIDPDSRLSHITKAIASLTVLRDAMIQDMWTDDRPPASEDGWINNDFAKKMIEEFKGEPVPPYTQKDHGE